ncbi:polysaccharide deacetylase family protein [Arthrobacter silvisoli]|uniref:polysaccharide deacetylase family protein n=1 Tax=Arthrobacter silvisoli TaxID=2291022 RepID=UPI000E214C0C|nr:polysaccharide deacetylase family protein [Arthrobacter silvisoli]
MGDSIIAGTESGAGHLAAAGRRTVLLAAAGLAAAALGACAGPGQRGGAPGPQGTATPSAVSVQEAPAASATHSGLLPAGKRPAPLSREAVVARYGGRQPAEWGMHVSGVATRSSSGKAVLTFDACGGPGGADCDERLLDTLRKLNVPATLFLNGRWIAANPARAAELGADPLFELANHGALHRPLSVDGRQAYGIPGTASVGEVYDELMDAKAVVERLSGKPCVFFRSGTAHYDDVAAAIARRLGQVPVNFSVNGDAGATFSPAQVTGELAGVGGGDIVISHFNHPASGTAAGYAAALPRLLDRGVVFARLGEVARQLK